ncbi:sulfurtransferase [Marmoricola sp. Leaf446]|uniref:rhodanese-like domain-containing protein n=1 Tax=Marmoricola sp. Leaf446 TaxID=1736379 RepID=UPI0006FA9FDF|nr:rhodanese-like domain-containing protein [Marmoricola sp. Leaf446]KQT90750.1 sulfurtransferase [Marmoricola sp. Leaf446]
MIEVPTIEVAQVPDPLPAGVTVLDVREPVEWQHGHIDGALHVPLTQVPDRLEELPQDQQLLVVCKVGGRSAQATAFLREKGFEAVNLAGGMIDWADADRPMVAETGQDPAVV